MTGKESDELLLGSAKYCTSRLIQKAYEMHQYSITLSNTEYFKIQASANIMKDTKDSIIYVFGIPFRLSG
ncbi:MAG: hypothetical protein L0H53_12020 [Candidatus Nitrosocosmicus sp.]|nr:hypothetical protein [Candidatus Nitrosocosmicus sp.]MDN5868673.1 hypothetical protein [Candidatus Nitrosocosmicus sp.]